MSNSHPLRALSRAGVFRGETALSLGLSRKQLAALVRRGVIERELPNTYRMSALPRSNGVRLRAALMWAGDESAAARRSAGEHYGLEGVRSVVPEIVVPISLRPRSAGVVVHRAKDLGALMIREWGGLRTTGIEATLVALAHDLTSEAFEVACEDARRRRLTSVPAIRAYVDRFGARGQRGLASLRALVGELDPAHPSRSTLEVKTRRLLVAHGITNFVREYPLTWHGHTYFFDFCFEPERVILETNGRRWHDDPTDYEYDNEKWSVPGRLGYRIVLATWDTVTRHPERLLNELTAALAA